MNNPYGAVERSIVRLGRTARGIMGDIASERVKAGQTELAREKMRYDISALQGKHKVELAQIKATHKHREGVRQIQSTKMENQKDYQDKMLKLNRDRFDVEKGTLMTAEEAAGILYAGLPDQQGAASQIIGGMSEKMRGIKLPGKEWAGIIGQIRDAQRKKLAHEKKMGLLDYQTETAKLARAKVEKGAKPEMTESKALKEMEGIKKGIDKYKTTGGLGDMFAILATLNPKLAKGVKEMPHEEAIRFMKTRYNDLHDSFLSKQKQKKYPKFEAEGETKPAKPKPTQKPMEKMPPPETHKGRIIVDTETGQRYKSDGKKWNEL